MGVKISDCKLVENDTEIIKPYIDDKYSKDFKKYGTLHTGVDVIGEYIHSMSRGRVILANDSKVIVADGKEGFCYSNLVDTYVQEGDYIVPSQVVGQSEEYVHVEYITNTGTTWPVRVDGDTYYKQDPTDIIINGYQYNNSNSIEVVKNEFYELTDDYTAWNNAYSEPGMEMTEFTTVSPDVYNGYYELDENDINNMNSDSPWKHPDDRTIED